MIGSDGFLRKRLLDQGQLRSPKAFDNKASLKSNRRLRA